MKLGIGLPNTLVPELDRRLFLDWARLADEAGFHVLGTIDQPGYDSWEPLISLGIAASVTERIRLATTILQLANRNEVLVAKQAAVIDRVSGGRLDLGLAVGGRESDYQALGAPFPHRGRRFTEQVRKIRAVWDEARRSTPEEGITGPAPLQKPNPPIWIGAQTPKGLQRAVELGDGFVIGTAGPEMMAQIVPMIRTMAEQAGKKGFPVAGLAYCGVGDDPKIALERAAPSVLRYYRGQLWRPPEELIHHGPPEVIAEAVKEYERVGLDVLILFPEIPESKQVELLAEHVLPLVVTQ